MCFMSVILVIYLSKRLHVCVHCVQQLYDVGLTYLSSFKTCVQIFVLILRTCFSHQRKFTNYLASCTT
jgi:hypothetical protein